jgi:hypothetical protein
MGMKAAGTSVCGFAPGGGKCGARSRKASEMMRPLQSSQVNWGIRVAEFNWEERPTDLIPQHPVKEGSCWSSRFHGARATRIQSAHLSPRAGRIGRGIVGVRWLCHGTSSVCGTNEDRRVVSYVKEGGGGRRGWRVEVVDFS